MPFFVVVTADLEMRVPLAELQVETLAPTEFLPIDLHVDVNRLFSQERLARLAAAVQGSPDAPAVLRVGEHEAGGLLEMSLEHVRSAVRESQPTAGIRVQGDPRGQP